MIEAALDELGAEPLREFEALFESDRRRRAERSPVRAAPLLGPRRA